MSCFVQNKIEVLFAGIREMCAAVKHNSATADSAYAFILGETECSLTLSICDPVATHSQMATFFRHLCRETYEKCTNLLSLPLYLTKLW